MQGRDSIHLWDQSRLLNAKWISVEYRPLSLSWAYCFGVSIRSVGCFMSSVLRPSIVAGRQTPPEGASNVTAISSVLLRAYRVLELQMNHLFQMHARMRSLLVREKDIERSSTSFAFNTFLAEIGSQLPSNVRSSGPHAKNQAQRRKHQTGFAAVAISVFHDQLGLINCVRPSASPPI